MHGNIWSEREKNLLKMLYPTETQELIMRNLPGRTWRTIKRQASIYKIKRARAIYDLRDRHDYLTMALIQKRIQKKWSQRKLARRIFTDGFHAHERTGFNILNRWEKGVATPRNIAMLLKWADALNCKLTLVDKEEQ